MTESNTIEVNLVAPWGKDKKVFEVIRQPKYLYLIQTGWAGDREHLFSMEVVELLRTHPKTGYGRALRRGLTKYYESPTFYDNLEAREQIRQVLGIETNVLFPEDRRLDREFELTLTEKTSIPDLVRKVSDVSGVPLDASPDLNRRSKTGTFGPMPLRTFVQRLHSPIIAQYWERRGDGYFLRLGPFAEDGGLHGRILVYFPNPTPLADVLRHISKRSYKRFDASPELQDRKVQMAVETDERTLMRRLSKELDATWVRRGKGYYLTREPENPEPDPSQETKSNKKP